MTVFDVEYSGELRTCDILVMTLAMEWGRDFSAYSYVSSRCRKVACSTLDEYSMTSSI